MVKLAYECTNTEIRIMGIQVLFRELGFLMMWKRKGFRHSFYTIYEIVEESGIPDLATNIDHLSLWSTKRR